MQTLQRIRPMVFATLLLIGCDDDEVIGGLDATSDGGVRSDAPAYETSTDADDAWDAVGDVPVETWDGGPQLDTSIDASSDTAYGDGDSAADVVATDAEAGRVCGPFVDAAVPLAITANPTMSFFVSSQTNPTGDLGGLAGADLRCQQLAQAAGVPSANWRAYLSVERGPTVAGGPIHARDRIGSGPWYNARGALVAESVEALHARAGDASLFVDEHGVPIHGQWTGSGTPNEHDILTGSNPDGTVAYGKTCMDWMSSAGPGDAGVPDGGGGLVARVGHSDGIGPQCSTATSPTDYTSWNSSHDNAGCNDTAPRGGAGRIYCFLAR